MKKKVFRISTAFGERERKARDTARFVRLLSPAERHGLPRPAMDTINLARTTCRFDVGSTHP